MKTYYDILGVKENVDAKEIKKAFKELAKKFHPDLGKKKGKDYSKIFEEITVAYTILSNPKKRKIYDESLKNSKKPNFFENFIFKEIKNFVKLPDFDKLFSKKIGKKLINTVLIVLFVS